MNRSNSHDMNNSPPARQGISVKGIDERLTYALKQVIRLHVLTPGGLTHSW